MKTVEKFSMLGHQIGPTESLVAYLAKKKIIAELNVKWIVRWNFMNQIGLVFY